MQDDPRSFRQPIAERFSRLIIYIPASALIGIVITLVVGLNNPNALDPLIPSLATGALFGAIVGGFAIGGEAVTFHLFRPRSRRASQLQQILGYGLGGAVGYLAGELMVSSVAGEGLTWNERRWLYPTLFFGVFSVLVGLVFQTIEILRSRLEESISQLKDAEFAAKELDTARDIQRRLLPTPQFEGDGYSLRALNQPASVVAGDLYDYFELPSGRLAFAVGDVAGKGLGASLIMASVKARLSMLYSEAPLDELSRELNRQLVLELGQREFVALLLGRFDPSSGVVEWTNSGLPNPFLLGASDAVRELDSPGDRRPLGLRHDVAPQVATQTLELGDRLVVYTDGLPEAGSDSGGPRGYDWLHEQLVEVAREADLAEALLRRLRVGLESESADALADDCTVLALERRQRGVRDREGSTP